MQSFFLYKAMLVMVAALLPFQSMGYALPSGEQVMSGSAEFNQPDSNTLNITTSDKVIIHYDAYNIGATEHVRYVQPSASSVALNRVVGQDPSSILGSLSANGKVFLVNPNGVFFGQGARIDAAGFAASTLDISNEDFLNERYRFKLGGNAENSEVINEGEIVTSGGFAALLAPRVRNAGLIAARQGKVVMASGERVTLDFDGDGLMSFAVNGELENALLHNAGTLDAAGGEVLMAVSAAENVMDQVINQEGIVRAQSFAEIEGVIRLVSTGGGIVSNSGTLDVASESVGDNSSGGSIHILGDKVAVMNGSVIDASGNAGGGEILIGGDFQGRNPDIRNASRTFVDQETDIHADALISGDGGRLIVWSNDGTQVYGNLSARGGIKGGNGGLVETSGGWLQITNAPDIHAAMGIGGTWLIDPNNLEIVAGNGNTDINNGTPFVTTDDSAELGVDLIVAALVNGNVTVSTGTGGGNSQIGNIVWTADMNFNTIGTNKALTLNAHNDITLNGEISQSGAADDSLNVVFNADSDDNGGGAIIINNTIETGGGFLTFQDGVYLKANLDTSTDQAGRAGGNVTFENAVLVANEDGISITTTGQSGDGNIAFQSTLDSGNDYDYISDSTRTWQAARTHAESGDGDETGDTYLATVTSALENSIVTSTANGNQAWLGGSDSGTEGQWRWVTGPEGLEESGAGRQFWQGTSGGSAVNGQFENWNDGEPNDSGGNEDALQLGFGAQGRWNDLPDNNNALNYIRETNLAPTDLTLTTGTGSVSFSGAIGSNKALGDITIPSAGDISFSGTVATTGNVAMTNSGTLTTAAAADMTLGGAFTQSGTGDAELAGDITTTGGNINFNRPVSINTDVTFHAGGANSDMNVLNTFTKSAGTEATLTFRADDGIFFTSGADITSSSNALNIILNSDRDASQVGNINIGSGSVFTSNGGEIILSGGGGTTDDLKTTGFAYGTTGGGTNNRGVFIDNAQLLSGAGDITLRGTGVDTNSGVNQGVDIVTNSIVESSSGDINITGIAGDGSGEANQKGVVVFNGARVSTTGSGNINITGNANNDGTGAEQVGVHIVTNAVVRTDSTGSINITGTGGTSGAGTANYGVFIEGNSRVEGADSGAINIAATGGSSSVGIAGSNNVLLGEGPAAGTYSGDITITADKMNFSSLPTETTGIVTLRNQTAGVAINLGSATDNSANTLELSDTELDSITAGALRIGRNDGTAAGAISISAAINPGNTSVLSLITGSTVGQSAAVTAANLRVSAGDDVDLQTLTNDFDTVAAVTTSGDIRITDTDAMTAGTVDGVIGVTAPDIVVLRARNSGGSDSLDIDQAVSSDFINLVSTGSLDINANIGSGTPGTVMLTASTGTITQSSADTIDANSLTLAASGGAIGTMANPILTNATSLSVTSNGGNAFVTETDAITINNVSASGNNFTLDAGGAINGANDNGSADITAAVISLTSTSGGIGATTPIDITASSTLNADTSADGGNIAIDSIGDLSIGLVDAGAGNVTLDSTGAIDGVTDDDTADVSGGTINLTAALGGIGTGTPLDVTAATALNADTTADNSDIFIDSVGDLPVGLIDAGTGNVTLDSTGRIDDATVDVVTDIIASTISLSAASGISKVRELELAGKLVSPGDYIVDAPDDSSVVTANGSILDDEDEGDTDFTGGSKTLVAEGGIIGTPQNPIEVNLTGPLFVTAGGARNGVSMVMNGTTPDGLLHIIGNPPGLVIWNGQIVAGPGFNTLNNQIDFANNADTNLAGGIVVTREFTVAPLPDPVDTNLIAGHPSNQ